MREAIMIVAAAGLLAVAVYLSRECRPGDPGIRIGTVMIVGGC